MSGVAVCGLAALLAAVAACGGGSDPSKTEQGAAGSAVAQYWIQEAAGGKLPEAVGNVGAVGTGRIIPLTIRAEERKQTVKARFCVEYQYRENTTPFLTHARVYIAQLAKDGWRVEAVKPDGTCDGVS